MNNDRELVLSRIRESLKTAHLPAARARIPPRPPSPASDTTDAVESFAREFEAVGGQVHQPTSSARALELTIELMRAAGSGPILAWEDSELPLAGLGDALRAAGFIRLDSNIPPDPEQRRAHLAELERAVVGLTGALAGLTDTGSLVLLSGPTRPRLASLLPPVHIALLRVQDLFPTMASFFAAYPNVVHQSSNLVFITGPSRSADIELALTRGVHGPRQVHVVFVA